MKIHRVEILEGKYAATVCDDGRIKYERRGEPWPGAAGYTHEYALFVEPLLRRVTDLEAALIHEYHELVGGGDYLGEKLMTAKDKIDYMIARVSK